ncbi:MAG: thioredoxin family protein [Pseudomonadota bacterium]
MVERLTQFDFHHRLVETGGVSLVYFTAPGCGACRRLKQLLETHREAFARLHLFEVDAQQDMALTREFEVFHLPSLFLFRDGQFHAPLHAEPTPTALLSAIDAALAAEALEAP